MQQIYTDPVYKLLTYGRFEIRRSNDPWPDYLKLGFAEQHVPELIRMMTDDDLNNADQNCIEVWAPLHAWRTLGQLGAVEAAKPLVRLFDRLQEDDWLTTELPKVFSMIGSASIPIVAEYLGDHSVDEINRISVPTCLEQIASKHPVCRVECVGVLERQLTSYKTNGPTLNAFLVVSLTNLKATGAIDVIRKAYFSDCVDLTVQGDIEDVEIELGLRVTRDTPPPDVQLIPGLPRLNMSDYRNDILDGFSTDTATNHYRNVGRNDPCPCGSGKKFKKCCLH